VIAANKIDLLPSDVSLPRITDWIHQEIKEVCDLQSPKETSEAKYSHKESTALRRDGREVVIDGEIEENGILRRSNIHLVSCTTGFGMEELMANLAKQAIDHGNRVFVMGAANVGKSSFINRMLDTKYGAMRNKRQVNRRTQRDEVPLATVSNLPGTTLDFLKIKLPNGLTMIDTPGLLNKGQLTARLSPDELKQVIPKTKVNAVTLRVEEGKCVLAGGLAMFELTEVRDHWLSFCRVFSLLSNQLGSAIPLHLLYLERSSAASDVFGSRTRLHRAPHWHAAVVPTRILGETAGPGAQCQPRVRGVLIMCYDLLYLFSIVLACVLIL
jgi:hypothetical protein